MVEVVYEEFYDACIDGGHHNYVYDHTKYDPDHSERVYICTKCGKKSAECDISTALALKTMTFTSGTDHTDV